MLLEYMEYNFLHSKMGYLLTRNQIVMCTAHLMIYIKQIVNLIFLYGNVP